MCTQGTYSIRGMEGQSVHKLPGAYVALLYILQTQNKSCLVFVLSCLGRKDKNYVPPLFFEKAGDNNQRTNGPVNTHLISWPCKAQNIQNLENIWLRNDLDLQYSHTFMKSISCLYLPTFRSQASIVSEKSTVFTFSYRKA